MTPLTPAQMLEAARQSAMTSIQPQEDAIDQEQKTAQGAHDTRVGQITDWAGWQGGRLDKAFADATAAANNLIALQGGVDQKSKDALAAGLRGATSSTGDAAAMLGGINPDTAQVPGVLGSAADAAKSSELGIGGGVAASLGAMGEARGLAGIGLQQNQEQERQRFNAQLGDIRTRKNDLSGQIPGLIQASLKDQRDFAIAQAQFGEQKANRLFQQYLSEKELDLKTKDQTFQQWLARQTLSETVRSNKAGESATATQNAEANKIAWANVGINQTQANAQLAAALQDVKDAKDKTTKERAKARAAALQSGYDSLASFLAPQKGEAQHSTSNRYPFAPGSAAVADDPSTINIDESADATTPYKRTFDDAFRMLKTKTSQSDALRILMSSPYEDWRQKARTMLAKMKRRGGRAYSKGSGKPD